MIYGYARVSTEGQTLDAQARELIAAGAGIVHRETASGAKADRAELRRVLARLAPGDMLMVTRLDRLARSTRDLLNILAQVADVDAGFRSLRDTWADTTTAHGRLMVTILGGLAEFERELIRQRTGEGRKRAMAQGVQFGRKPSLTAFQKREATERLACQESTRSIARSFNVSHSTVSRFAAQLRAREQLASPAARLLVESLDEPAHVIAAKLNAHA